MQKLFTLLLLCIMVTTTALAQKITVQGTVKSSDGAAQIGVNVIVKNTTNGVVSNEDGFYSIDALPTDILVFSFIGYETQEVPVNGNSKLNVILKESDQKLDEVVITALGVKKDKTKLGYAVQDVKGDEIVKARDQNPIAGLSGKVSGLYVGQSAEMLRRPTVSLRGDGISLYVIDGVPISSDTWNISPDDVESYTILKGPTAAALYGSRAQSGAILITTKKGLKHKGVSVELNSTNSFDGGFLAFPRTQKEYGGGENCIYAFGDGKGGGVNDADYDVWGPKFRGQLLPQFDGEYYADQTFTTTFGDFSYTGHIKPTAYVARGKNNLENLLQTGFQTNNNLSVTATGDDYNIRFSLSHSHQTSIIPNNYLNITNFSVYGSYNVTPRLKIESNVNFNRQYTDNFPDVDYGPNSLIYNISVWTGADWDITDPKIKAIWQPGKTGTQSFFCEYTRYHNPYLMINEWLRGHYKTDINAYTSVNYKLNKIFDISLRTQVSTYSLLRTEKMPFSAHPYSREGNSGDYREDHRNLFDNNTDLQLNFKYSFAHDLMLSGLVGGNIRLFNYNSNFTTTDYLNIPNVYSFSNSKNPVQSNNFESNMEVLSAYGSFDFTFSKYGTISFTSRIDKSSALLPSSNTSYFYPSLSVATPVNQYIELPEIVSFLKLRASIAEVRNVNVSETIGTAPFNTITSLGGNASSDINGYPLDYGNNYQSPYGGPTYELMSTYNTSKIYDGELASSYTNNLIDPNIKSSNRVNYEAGFEAKFLQNRLGIDFTGFQYIDGPAILPNTISSFTGYTTYYINALKTKKTGIEITLSGTPLKMSQGLQWDVMVNWDAYQQIYLELPKGQDTYNTYFRQGDRVDKLYGSAFARSQDGQIIFDNAGKPLTYSKPQYLGNLFAKYHWSLINKFAYKQVSLSVQLDGSVGGVLIDYMHNKTMRGGANIETASGELGIARNEDDLNAGVNDYKGIYVGKGVVVANGAPNYNSVTGRIDNYDELAFATNTNTVQVQDYCSKYYGVSESNLMSRTYAKLREVTLSYDLPASWLQKTKFSKVTLSLVGRNLIYFYADKRFKDVDLEQYPYAAGYTTTGLQSPTTRRIGFNINIAF